MRKTSSSVAMILSIALLILTMGQVCYAQEKFGLANVPAIKNRTPIHVALEAGAGSELIIPFVKKFAEATGLKVTTESLVMSAVYPKLNVDFLSGTGAYDIAVVEASITNEWARFLFSVKELAQKFDPGGVTALEEDLKGQHPVMLRCASDIDGILRGLPYKTYNQFMYIRQDVFDHPIEKANFKKKFGYDLAPATEWKHIYDQAQFFTRKKGDLLKGEPLKDDLYGVAVMAGRYEINDEITTRIWSRGVDWRTLIRDASGRPKEFVISKKNKEVLKEALEDYKKLLPYASPGCLTGFWDFVSAQFESGKTIILPHLYASMHKWVGNVEDKVPGAKFAIYPVVGKKGYTGNFYQAVAKTSKNPEASYWLMRYITSYEAQKAAMEKGWSGTRTDVFQDPKYKAPEWRRLVGARGAMLTEVWNQPDLLPFLNDAFYFNSNVAGKIYEIEIILCHEAMTGQRTIDDTVKEITRQTIELQRKFGTLPIREE